MLAIDKYQFEFYNIGLLGELGWEKIGLYVTAMVLRCNGNLSPFLGIRE
jgi:hypothetical protein